MLFERVLARQYPSLIIFLILITCLLDSGWISLGEIRCWSLFNFKGLLSENLTQICKKKEKIIINLRFFNELSLSLLSEEIFPNPQNVPWNTFKLFSDHLAFVSMQCPVLMVSVILDCSLLFYLSLNEWITLSIG